jgi:hypothetical protein
MLFPVAGRTLKQARLLVPRSRLVPRPMGATRRRGDEVTCSSCDVAHRKLTSQVLDGDHLELGVALDPYALDGPFRMIAGAVAWKNRMPFSGRVPPLALSPELVESGRELFKFIEHSLDSFCVKHKHMFVFVR